MSQHPHIAVVGTGPAAAGTLTAIYRLHPQAKVTIFDLGERTANPPVSPHDAPGTAEFYESIYRELKQKTGLKFPPIKSNFTETLPRFKIGGEPRFFRSSLFGGLSNYWGATALPFSDEDLKSWPVSRKELDPYYEEIANIIGISGRQDALSAFYGKDFSNSPPTRILKGLEALSTRINSRNAIGEYEIFSGANRAAIETRPERNNHCVACGECMAGCFRGSVWSASMTIEQLILDKQIEYITARVHKVATGVITAECDKKLQAFKGYDRIYLCAGCPGTTEILMRSLGLREGPVLVDNAIFQFPILNLNLSQADKDKNHYTSATNTILACKARNDNNHSVQVQVYPNFDYLWRCALPEPAWKSIAWLIRWSRDRLLWGRAYLHSDHGYTYNAMINNRDEIEFTERKSPDCDHIAPPLKSLKSVVDGGGFYIPPIKPVLSKTSSHIAATFPYGGSLAQVKRDGEILPGVNICDSSCFPDSPATSPTLTIMANAARTVEESLS